MVTDMMKTWQLSTLILMLFISFLSKTSSVAEAARLPGGTDYWYANSLRVLERREHSPPPYPKPAPPERYDVTSSYYSKNRYEMRDEDNDDSFGRPKHPPPSYPKPAPPERYEASSGDQFSVLATTTHSYRSTI